MPLTSEMRSQLRSPFKDRVVCIHTGKLLEITYVPARPKEVRPKKRGIVKGFTRSARLRMLKTVASIQWDKIRHALFITLTYPSGTEAYDLRARSTQKYLFLRHMEKYLQANVPTIWRIEWKIRRTGSEAGLLFPHFHLLACTSRFIPHRLVRAWWRDSLGCSGPLATDVRRVVKGEIAGKYVAKYCSKLPDASSLDNVSYRNNLGRHWGIHRRHLLPFYEPIIFCNLRPDEIQFAENAACMVLKDFTRGARTGFCLLGDLAEKVGQEIWHRQLDSKRRSC